MYSLKQKKDVDKIFFYHGNVDIRRPVQLFPDSV